MRKGLKQGRQRMAATERSTRNAVPGDVTAAWRTFRDELSPMEQSTLVAEITSTRGAELCRAYANVITLARGYKEKHRKDGRRIVRKIPCVTFVVKEKWADPTHGSESQLLPKYLFAYWQVGEERKLCAVPTDVDDASEMIGIKPQGRAVPVKVDHPNTPFSENGTITCAIQRMLLPNKSYLLSCRHVFSEVPKLRAGGLVKSRNSGKQIAVTRNVRGELSDGSSANLDAQLAEITQAGTAADALKELTFTDIVRTQHEIPDDYFIITPKKTLKAKKSKILDHWTLSYDRQGMRNVPFSDILKSEVVGDVVIGGDSGSPVATQRNGGKLIGMHFAGQKSSAFAIPAWKLLDPANYKGASKREVWRLTEPEAVEVPPDQPREITSQPIVSATPAAPEAHWLTPLKSNHNFNGGARWRLSSDGIRVNNKAPEVTSGEPETVRRVWTTFGPMIRSAAQKFDVPVELIIATICTESSGKPAEIRKEPGYTSDRQTPNKISVGLMQTLIGTAREALHDNSIDRSKLLQPRISIQAGTAYIARQRRKTGFDPPKVACAYNAGGVYRNNGQSNRWRMKQYPIGTGKHANRFVKWFNDCFRYFDSNDEAPARSFWRLLNE